MSIRSPLALLLLAPLVGPAAVVAAPAGAGAPATAAPAAGSPVAPSPTPAAAPTPSSTSPASAAPSSGAPSSAPAAATPSEGATGKEKQLLERIRQMKAPRWRPFGVCRYDWSAWKLSQAGVRFTAVECGDPPVAGSVAVHCETLRVNRRVGDGPWENWRLPYSAEESTSSGGEDRMVAFLCSNVQPGAASAQPAAPATAPPTLDTPAPARPAATPATGKPSGAGKPTGTGKTGGAKAPG